MQIVILNIALGISSVATICFLLKGHVKKKNLFFKDSDSLRHANKDTQKHFVTVSH